MTQSTSMTQTGAKATIEEKKIVNYLVEKLQGIFVAWRVQIKTQEELNRVKEQWFLALTENKINSFEYLSLGLKRARRFNSPHWPSCGMFIEWCEQERIESLNIPDSYEVFKKLSNYQGDNLARLDPYSYWIWQQMDKKRFKESRTEQAEKYLSTIYKTMLKKSISGFEFPKQPLALAKQVITEKTDEEIKLAEASLSTLSKIFEQEARA